jgi:hypothetical protein
VLGARVALDELLGVVQLCVQPGGLGVQPAELLVVARALGGHTVTVTAVMR